MFFQKKTPYEKEIASLLKNERRFLKKRAEKKDSFLNNQIEKVVPPKLQSTLDAAFAKAFELIFEKGTKVIEKTYNKESLKADYYENKYNNEVLETKKTLRAFSKKAKSAGNKNLLLSGAAGIGMGIIGVGLPDIPIFTGLLLKSIYEIALDYGFEYESEKERAFILWVITGAVSYGDKITLINRRIDRFIATGELPDDYNRTEAVSGAAGALSKELLYMKFIQGIPIAGALGGLYDAVYMKRINEYANLKYRRRQLIERKRKS